MPQVQRESHHTRAGLEAGDQYSVASDHTQPGQRHRQCVTMERRDTQQRELRTG